MGLSLLLKISSVNAIAGLYIEGSSPDAGNAWSTHHRLLFELLLEVNTIKPAKNRKIWDYMDHRGNRSPLKRTRLSK